MSPLGLAIEIPAPAAFLQRLSDPIHWAHMKSRYLGMLAVAMFVPALLTQNGANPFLGRWDVTITTPNGSYPDWIEVTEANGALAARVQPRGGSVHPAAAVKMEGSHLLVTVSAATARRPEITWDLTKEGDRLSGSQKMGDRAAQIAGVRAPALNRKPPKGWSKPEPLFDGKDLAGWEPDKPSVNHWVARDGVLLNEAHGANLRTTRKFNDFKLHIDFNCPDDGNSGVYLRGRYEVQVEYEPVGTEDKYHSMGAIYGMVAPSVELPRKPGQWESFDIMLVGRRVTIVRDDVKTVDNQEIPGITGGALDSNEGEPGPFYIQGDHTGGMKYRNITVQVPVE